MSRTINESGDSPTIADLNNPVLWSQVQATILPKVRQALRNRFGLASNAPDAEDAVQSGVRVLLAKSTSREPQHYLALTLEGLENWLVRTAQRKLKDAHSRKSHRTEVTGTEISEAPARSEEHAPLEQLLVAEARERIEDLHTHINEDQRHILHLWLEGRSQREIAELRKITRARVESALAAIFATARRLWGEDGN